jgi:hypothetical protein
MNNSNPLQSQQVLEPNSTSGDIPAVLDMLHSDGETFELCAIGPKKSKSSLWEGFAGGGKGIVAGWFNDKPKAAALAGNLDSVGAVGIYVTLNPCSDALLARANNRLKAGVSRTRDEEVMRLRWLLVDGDLDGPSGISTTDREHGLILEHMAWVKAQLSLRGWPDPIVADSGNGGHLLYRLPGMENNQKNVQILQNVLRALSSLFSADNDGVRIKIDEKVFNPSRISKLYGTMARKGDPTEERPHRLSKVLVLPDEAIPVSLDLLESIASCAVHERKEREYPALSISEAERLDVPSYLRHYGYEVVRVVERPGRAIYVIPVCLFDPSHKGKEAGIGQKDDGTLFYQCFHDSCKSHTWNEARQIISGSDKLTAFFPIKGRTGGYSKQAVPLKDGAAQNETTAPEAVSYLPPPPPFPLEIFPHEYRLVIEEHSKAFAVPLDIPACALLSMAGACIGRTRGILIKPGWIEHANLWVAIVGGSGTGKSPVTRSIHAHVFGLEQKWSAEHKEARKEYEYELEKRRNAPRKDRQDFGPAPDPPNWKQLIIDDTSTESIADSLVMNPRGVLWYRDELAGLILDLDKYGSGKDGGAKSRLMSSYDSGPWKVNRVGPRRHFIPHANLSIFGTIQPRLLPVIFSNMDAATGFLPRFIFVRTIQEKPPLWTEATVSEESKNALVELTEGLLTYELNTDGKPLVIGVRQSAKALFKAWYNEQVCEPWVDAEASVYEAVLAKLRGQCLRFALILHCMDAVAGGRTEMQAVTEETMAKAIRLANCLKEHQKTAWQFVMNAGFVAELTPIQKRVVRAILDLETSIANGVMFTSQLVEHLNKGMAEQFKVRAETVGKTVVSLGFTTRKSDGRKCFNISPEDLSKLRALASGNVPTIPNIPETSGGATQQAGSNIPPGSLTSLLPERDRDVRDVPGTLNDACNPAPDISGGMIGTLGMYPGSECGDEWEEWEV